MIYVISISNKKLTNREDIYTFYETTTGSFFSGSEQLLQDLITKGKVHQNHNRLIGKDKTDKVWFHNMNREYFNGNNGSLLILLCERTDGNFKLVSWDRKIFIVSPLRLTNFVASNKVANCVLENNEIKQEGTYNTEEDIDFEKTIAEKYEKYVVLTSMLGCKLTFSYVIEGKEVIIKQCKEATEKVIIPQFITAIWDSAFFRKEIKELTINEGLKSIGSYSFGVNDISKLVIPKSMEFISLHAFSGNKRLINEEGYTDNIKILGKPIILGVVSK